MRTIARESLTIVGWVAMWRPLQTFLYDWWPLARRIRVYKNLRASVVIGVDRCLRGLRPGGILFSLGVYSTDLKIRLLPFAVGLGDHRIITTFRPGGKERMRRLMSAIDARRVNPGTMVTHRFMLGDIEAAYELFSHSVVRRPVRARFEPRR